MSKFTVYTTDKEPARTTVFIRCVSGISVIGGDSYTDEQAQDAVGTILANTANISLTYDDGTPQITANLTTAVTDSLAKADTALQSSEVDANIKTLALPANTTISAFIKTLLDDANQAAARATLGVDAAGTDNSTNVTLVGTPDYITISGQEITRNQIDLAADVTGVLPVANYATGMPDGTKFVRDDGTLVTPPDTNTTDHTDLTNIGTKTHAQIDTHIASTANPHGVTKAQVGLADADNTSDADKPVSTATQTALNLKADKSNVLELDNTGAFTPDADYEPATKKYVDDLISYTVRTVAGTTDTLVVGDTNNVVRYTAATNVTVTVPSGLGSKFNCLLIQDGDGQVIWSASGTTIKCLNSHTRTGGNGAMVSILAIAANDLRLSGQTGV